jgi:integrase
MKLVAEVISAPRLITGGRDTAASCYSRRVAHNTMLRALAIIHYAYANGMIGRDPTAGVDAAPKRRADDAPERVTPEQVPTRSEVLAILTNTPSGYRAAVALGLAGLRIGEVLGMSADRIALDKREVTVNRQAQPLTGKGMVLTTPKAEKVRTIRVPGLVAVELRRRLREHAEGMLFPGTSNGLQRPLDLYRRAWQPALKAAGLVDEVAQEDESVELVYRFVFHSLRHFAASTLLAEGAPITAVAGHLGDAVQTVSRTYAHWLRDDRDVPGEVLDRVLAPDSRVTGVSRAVGDNPTLSV